MSKTIQHKIASNSKSLNVLLISCFFIVVSFFLHNQHSFFNLNKSIGRKIDFFTDVKNAKYPTQFHFATTPSIESVINVNQLEDTEEDNEQKSSQVICDEFSQNFLKNEHSYSNILRSRYSQFALSIHKRSQIPYFILHHSWKTHIS
jgi:hypothetical protein